MWIKGSRVARSQGRKVAGSQAAGVQGRKVAKSQGRKVAKFLRPATLRLCDLATLRLCDLATLRLDNMFLDTLVVGPLQENSYVVACEETKEAVIIDPGAEAERIYRVVTFHGFTLKHVMNTHGHIDHVGGVADIIKKTGVPFLLHENDMYLIEGIENDPLQMYLHVPPPPAPERFLHDGDIITVGKIEFRVLHTPGHTPGSVCFLTGKILFSGDTLFSNSIGRSDLPGGNHEQLLTSIREKLLPLDDDVRVYSGHGNVTTIGSERQFNPFF